MASVMMRRYLCAKHPLEMRGFLSAKNPAKNANPGRGLVTRLPSCQGPKKGRSLRTSYSKMTIPQAEERLGITLTLRGVPIKTMLEDKLVIGGSEGILQVKEKVYDGLVGHLEIEGYPSTADPDFKEANISDLVISILQPVLRYFRRQSGRNLRLRREKEIIAKDAETHGVEEFVVMDFVSLKEEAFVLIVEAKRANFGEARKQCFLAMRDMRENNGGGVVYGFVTAGDRWRMARYDGVFQLSEGMEIIFDSMDEDKERWIKDYSIIVDCLLVALNSGGMTDK